VFWDLREKLRRGLRQGIARLLFVTIGSVLLYAKNVYLLQPRELNPVVQTVHDPDRPQGGDRSYWLAWSQLKGIGPHRLKRIWQEFGSLQTAWEADILDLTRVEGIGSQLGQSIYHERQTVDPDKVLEALSRPQIPFLTPADPDYPALLWELPDPPPILYVLGHYPQWIPTVAIVGTRSPTPYGRRWTEKIAGSLAEAGFVIVSGMAAGIDGVAHQACLQVGGKTLAVVGTGVDRIYPSQHKTLYRRIQEQGAIISEFPPGTDPAKENFPRRNRIIAGLCQTVLVMEAPEKSGALITAYLANDYNRDVYALPGNIDTQAARGCLQLIQRGASLILSAEELLTDLEKHLSSEHSPRANPSSGEAPDPTISLQGEQLMIWQILTQDPIGFDALAQATHLDINTLSSALLMLELEGLVIQLPGMRYQRALSY
jgi:DNA processing protein